MANPTVRTDFTGDSRSVEAASRRAQRSIGGLGGAADAANRKLASLAKGFTAGALVAGIGRGVRALSEMTAEAGKASRALLDARNAFGITTAEMQRFYAVGQLAGQGVADIDNLLRRMNLTIGEAISGGGAMADAMARLGVSADNDAASGLDAVLRALSRLDTATAAYIAKDIFGIRYAQGALELAASYEDLEGRTRDVDFATAAALERLSEFAVESDKLDIQLRQGLNEALAEQTETMLLLRERWNDFKIAGVEALGFVLGAFGLNAQSAQELEAALGRAEERYNHLAQAVARAPGDPFLLRALKEAGDDMERLDGLYTDFVRRTERGGIGFGGRGREEALEALTPPAIAPLSDPALAAQFDRNREALARMLEPIDQLETEGQAFARALSEDYWRTFNDEASAAADQLDRLVPATETWGDALRANVGGALDTISDQLLRNVANAESFGDALLNLGSALALQFVSDRFSPAPRAAGGPVVPGQPYVVGEHRPELFVPAVAGRIAPDAREGGGGDTFNIVGHVDPHLMRQWAMGEGRGVIRRIARSRA